MAVKQPREVIAHWIETTVNEAIKPLSKWESNFLADIADQFDRTGSLSDKQEEVLERVYSEKTK